MKKYKRAVVVMAAAKFKITYIWMDCKLNKYVYCKLFCMYVLLRIVLYVCINLEIEDEL